MAELEFSNLALKQMKKCLKRRYFSTTQLNKTLECLIQDTKQSHIQIKTHVIENQNCLSSSINGEYRILWNKTNEKSVVVIKITKIGTHKKVYGS